MPKKSPKLQKATKVSSDWFHACLTRTLEDISIGKLDKSDLERITIAAICEHRHLLEHAQKLHEQVNTAKAAERAGLLLAYHEAQRTHDEHHIVVHMLIDMLGYVPKFEQGPTTH